MFDAGSRKMHFLQELLVLAGVLTLSMISPGPNFAIVTATAINVSRRAGVISGLGMAAASATWALLTVAGLGIVIAHLGWLYVAIRITGALYLLFLGARMLWRAKEPAKPDVPAAPASGREFFRKAYFASLTNPKSAAFYGSVLAVMMPGEAPLWFSAAVVAIAGLLSALWYCGIAVLLSTNSARRRFAKGKAILDTVIGVVLMGLGAKLLAGP